jgi:flagellar basal-body rod modification protein FlgD
MTTPIGPTTPTTTPIADAVGKQLPATADVKDNSALDKDAFLKLLVDQLKYQDPMNPAQGTEFLAQTAQFTTVEKLTDLADVQQQMLTAQLTLGAANMIGRTVTYNDASGNPTTGAVTGATLGTNPTLTVNGMAIPLGSISTIGQAGATPSAAGTPVTPVQGVGAPAAGTGTPAATAPAAGTPATGTPASGTPASGTPAAGAPATGPQSQATPPPLTTSPPGSSPVTGAPSAPATGAPATSTPTPGGQVPGGQDATLPSLNNLPTNALPVTLPATLPATNPSVPAGTATSPVTGQPLSTQPAAPSTQPAAPSAQPAAPSTPAAGAAPGSTSP